MSNNIGTITGIHGSTGLTTRQAGTKRFIFRRGTDLQVEASFLVTQEAPIGSSQVQVHDTLGILPGTTFKIGETVLEVDSVELGHFTLVDPLDEIIPVNTLLKFESESKGLFVAPGRDITRYAIEFNRRMRVPYDLVISYGSIVYSGTSKYFVTGYQEGDSSISIGLRLINEYIDWYSTDPEFESTPLEEELDLDDLDPFNAFGPSDSSPPDSIDWPSSPGMVPIQKGIPAYQEQISVYSSLEEPGYIPRLSRIYLVPIWYDISDGDYIKTSEATMRVIGRDLGRVRNMQALSVDYYRGVGVDG